MEVGDHGDLTQSALHPVQAVRKQEHEFVLHRGLEESHALEIIPKL